ncbi:hypothetical protein T4B_14982 [Trichinella pseudospiralis]|uniref:Uncharacterized protein n=1 Tax=Trichinella pseudospiralis TaxID=6337 RepID=A0A0V1GAW8_TRIPS|nr:hypothetical protein T4A_4304 [Trichinella pseudospiralis]KRY64665.1 hypothetical protein T4A_944 [Trichinella pseudospiralis]KRY95447.1 hypothetical protein T4B_14982 [Trichinella pseudospiralis]KRY98909.1 hypothetical protein T4C_11048 [Trichinella pseudospiralis]
MYKKQKTSLSDRSENLFSYAYINLFIFLWKM